MGRPQYRQTLEDAKAGRSAIILDEAIDRPARRTTDITRVAVIASRQALSTHSIVQG